MELNEWMNCVGGHEAVAELIQENPRTVYSWYRLERVPGLESAIKLVSVSAGLVDYNGIYGPLARRRLERSAQC